MAGQDIPATDWDTFIKHAWYGMKPQGRLEDWPNVSRCEETASLLRDHGVKSILDAAAGYGLKTFQFKRLGFDVVGTDQSGRGIELARTLGKEIDMEVEFRRVTWAEIPKHFSNQFDAVYNDNFQNATNLEELRDAARAAFAAVKAGGIALFGSRTKDQWHATPAERVEAAWVDSDPTIWWNVETPDGRVVTIALSERYPKGIYRRFIHLVDGARLEHSGWYYNLEWSYADCEGMLTEQGFSSVELRELPSGQLEGVAVK